MAMWHTLWVGRGSLSEREIPTKRHWPTSNPQCGSMRRHSVIPFLKMNPSFWRHSSRRQPSRCDVESSTDQRGDPADDLHPSRYPPQRVHQDVRGFVVRSNPPVLSDYGGSVASRL